MIVQCEVLETYNSSAGKIITIGLFKATHPPIGSILFDDKFLKWKIVALGSDRKQVYTGVSSEKYVSIWDCIIEPINHNEPVKIGSTIFFNSLQANE